jgi:glyoxylase-like metal-dependent hydrolase (beta-lactamase superfamily II)
VLGLIIAVVFIIGRSAYKQFMEVQSIAVDKNLTVFLGGGGNSIVLTSDDGTQALVVDTKMDAAAKTLAASVKARDVTIVNTHYHRDHVGGNSLFPKATLIAGAYTPEQWRAMAATNRYPDNVVKPGEETVLKIAGETVHVRNMGRAHSWDDVVVYLENRKFLVTGDIVFNHRNPALFRQGGTNGASWVAALDSLLRRYDPEKVLPGHGQMSDKTALTDAKEYFTSIMDAIGNPEKIAAVKEKYKNYPGIPMMADLNRTIKFLEDEKKNANK